MQKTIVSSFSHKFFTALVIMALVVAALPATTAYAASTITVNTVTDEYTADGNLCSLREAIALANSNAASDNDCTRSGVDVDDIIVLQSDLTYTLILAGSGGTSVGDLDVGDSGGASGNLTIQASGSTTATIDGNDIDRVLDVDAAGNPSLTLIGITVTNGNTTGKSSITGGGISFSGTGTLTLTNSTVSDNVSTSGAGCGGGIYNNSGAAVVITNSTISGNSCPTAGADGGGIFKGGGTGGGSLTITGSTISGNSTAENGGGMHIGNGASTITVNITNSTFANNIAGNRGGGLQVGADTAVVTVDFSTFSGNTANENNTPGGTLLGGGAVQISMMSSVTITRSILANSLVTLGQVGTPKDCEKAGTATVSITDSIVENDHDCTGSNPPSMPDPQLSALADNGGPTQTMAIPAAGPAYNTAPSCGSVTTDQRGFTRPQIGACDLGAYEAQNAAAPTVLSVVRAGANPTNDATVNFTVTFSESVTGVDPTDFNLVTTGVTGASLGTVTGSGATRTVAVNTGTGDGTIQLVVLDDNTILGGADPLDGGFTTGEVYTIDKTAPTVSITPADDNILASSTVDFGIAFSETVTGVNQADFTLVPTGVTGASISGFNGLGATYTITANTGSGDGTIGLNLNNSGTGIADAAGNSISGGATGEVYTILRSAAAVDVNIAGNTEGDGIIIPFETGQRHGFPVDNGPVQIVSTNGFDIIAALRVIWKEPGPRTSYSEMMGLPAEQLSSEYWFPWYNNTDTLSMDQGFRIANVDDTDTTIKVMLGMTELDSILLGPGESVRRGYSVNNGPIRIYSQEGNNILAALRVIWQEPGPGIRYSYSEMMGLPFEQLSDEYWFPWYNNTDTLSMDQGFRIASVNGSGDNTVEVWVGTEIEDSFTLAQGASIRVGYDVNSGPIRIVCTTCTGNEKIITSLRVIWQEPGFRASYSEMMGLPVEQLSTEYWFPWYNNTDTLSMDQGFRIANVDDTAHTVRVFLGANQVGEDISLAGGGSTRVGFAVNNGPIRIVCTTCNPANSNDRIITALRVIWQEPNFRASYSEMMGLPVEALSSEYWFPWYNNAAINSMDQGFRISAP